MKIDIQAPDIKAKDSLTNFVNEHVKKLLVFSDRIIESAVYLKVNRSGKKENKVCEIRLAIPGYDLFAGKSGKTFEEAVVLAVDALKHQIENRKGTKEKRQTLRS